LMASGRVPIIIRTSARFAALMRCLPRRNRVHIVAGRESTGKDATGSERRRRSNAGARQASASPEGEPSGLLCPGTLHRFCILQRPGGQPHCYGVVAEQHRRPNRSHRGIAPERDERRRHTSLANHNSDIRTRQKSPAVRPIVALRAPAVHPGERLGRSVRQQALATAEDAAGRGRCASRRGFSSELSCADDLDTRHTPSLRAPFVALKVTFDEFDLPRMAAIRTRLWAADGSLRYHRRKGRSVLPRRLPDRRGARSFRPRRDELRVGGSRVWSALGWRGSGLPRLSERIAAVQPVKRGNPVELVQGWIVQQNGGLRMAIPVLRVGVVGFGYWGPNVVRSLSRLEHARIVILCDLSEANLKRSRHCTPASKPQWITRGCSRLNSPSMQSWSRHRHRPTSP